MDEHAALLVCVVSRNIDASVARRRRWTKDCQMRPSGTYVFSIVRCAEKSTPAPSNYYRICRRVLRSSSTSRGVYSTKSGYSSANIAASSAPIKSASSIERRSTTTSKTVPLNRRSSPPAKADSGPYIISPRSLRALYRCTVRVEAAHGRGSPRGRCSAYYVA